MQDRYDVVDDTTVETPADSRQHVNPDGETDAEKGARAGGIGGAVTGAVAGAMMGPGGALLGAVIGGVAGAVASGAAVAAVDTVDGDEPQDGAHPIVNDGYPVAHGAEPMIDNGIPGVQTGGHAVDGTMDTRGMAEKTADAITGDPIDDKTGKRID